MWPRLISRGHIEASACRPEAGWMQHDLRAPDAQFNLTTSAGKLNHLWPRVDT
jgi:hypothetical protein